MVLTITQSAIRYVYPLNYLQDFNDSPYEIVFGSDASGNPFNAVSNPCKDSPTSAAPACGWTLSPSGEHIPYSQGFCCSCDVPGQFLSTVIPRSNLQCSVLSARQATASCLRFSPLWWSGFRVGPPRLTFTMNIHMLYCRPTPAALAAAATAALAAAQAAADAAGVPLTPAAAAQASQAPALTCSSPTPSCTCDESNSVVRDALSGLPPLGSELPQRCYSLPGGSSAPVAGGGGAEPCDVLFTLLGTFVPLQGVPDYTSKTLLVPSSCDLSATASAATPCAAALTLGWANWLLVDNALLSLDGATCNRVGTSFQAFNTQGSPCLNPAGTCLGGSPYALLAADLLRAPGMQRSLFTSFRSPTAPPEGTGPLPQGGLAGVQALQGARSAPASSSLSFIVPTGDFQKSLFTLTLRATPSSFRVVQNIAQGVILGVQAPSFSAGGGAGALTVALGSWGPLAAAFTLVCTCSPPALPISALPITLPPPSQRGNASSTITLKVLPLAIVGTLGASLLCNVTLLDSLGGVSDSVRQVAVGVTALVTDKGSQGGEVVGGAGGGGFNASAAGALASAGACGVACASWLDVACAVRSASSCTERLIAWGLGSGLGLLASLAALVCLLRNPALVCGAVRAVAGAACGGGGGAHTATTATATSTAAGGGQGGAGEGGRAKNDRGCYSGHGKDGGSDRGVVGPALRHEGGRAEKQRIWVLVTQEALQGEGGTTLPLAAPVGSAGGGSVGSLSAARGGSGSAATSASASTSASEPGAVEAGGSVAVPSPQAAHTAIVSSSGSRAAHFTSRTVRPLTHISKLSLQLLPVQPHAL